jgi:hypothetical protein
LATTDRDFRTFKQTFRRLCGVLVGTPARRVSEDVPAELGRVRRAGSLLFRCTCQETSLLRWTPLFVNRECRCGDDLHQDDDCADFEIHCQVPWFRALFGDDRRSDTHVSRRIWEKRGGRLTRVGFVELEYVSAVTWGDRHFA